MTDQQEERLRSAARAWLRASDDVAAAIDDGSDAAEVMELADQATLSRLVFQQTLVDLGWTPPAPAPPAPPAPRETG
jgi:hypothetical protein